MGRLVQSLEAVGYVPGSTLFGASYDFRKICSSDMLQEYITSLVGLIENAFQVNGNKKVVMVGHGLGAPLVNYFFSRVPKEWKDMYIKCFVSFSGSFGGCPKALRTLLSGTETNNFKERTLLREVSKNFAGIQWMLPSPSVYGDYKLINFRQRDYASKDIPQLMKLAGYNESSQIYENIVLPVQTQSLQAPHVTTYVFAGSEVPTESSYIYSNSLTESPIRNYPLYQTDLPYGDNFDFPQKFNGDGTMPRFSLEIPMGWSNYQKEPVYYRFYNGCEHKEILEMQEPIRDFIGILYDE